MVGLSFLTFNDSWARFNQETAGIFSRWHRDFRNSRALILVVGVGVCIWGAVALIGAVVSSHS
jgi:hypothetical protein